jgi:hypothetical protein
MNLATRLGMLGEGATAKPMSPPDATRLGPRFDVYFFRSCLPNFGRCRSSIHEALYPFAYPNPVAYLRPGQGRLFAKMFGRKDIFAGWVKVIDGSVVRQQLLALGASAYLRSSTLPSHAPQAVENTRASPFLIVGVVLLACALLAWAYRSRERRAAG